MLHKKTRTYLAVVILLSTLHVSAQTASSNEAPPIAFKGKIHFERKNNVHKQLDEIMKSNQGSNAMVDQIKKNTPKYKIDKFELFFNQDKSLYKLAPDGLTEIKMIWGSMPAEKNIVFQDFTARKTTAEKYLFDKTYLIQDSIKKFTWKITEEFRKVAGYNCRRAETIIMDSIYVVAFYTDAIVCPTGPEGFNGLPGAILGIVMPRLNLQYFATKVENYLPSEKELMPPTKGEKKTFAQVEEKLRDSMKQWGEFLQRMLWYTSI